MEGCSCERDFDGLQGTQANRDSDTCPWTISGKVLGRKFAISRVGLIFCWWTSQESRSKKAGSPAGTSCRSEGYDPAPDLGPSPSATRYTTVVNLRPWLKSHKSDIKKRKVRSTFYLGKGFIVPYDNLDQLWGVGYATSLARLYHHYYPSVRSPRD